MYLKLIDQGNIKHIIQHITKGSVQKIMVVKYYENIYVIVNLKNYSILFLVKYKINSISDVNDIYNDLIHHLKIAIKNTFIELKWNYYFKCKKCTMNNILSVSYVNNDTDIKQCVTCTKSTQCDNLIELVNSRVYHIDCINNNPNCIYGNDSELLFQCEFCNKYVLLSDDQLKYRKNVDCKNYYWKEIIDNSSIKDYSIFKSENKNYMIINLETKSSNI